MRLTIPASAGTTRCRLFMAHELLCFSVTSSFNATHHGDWLLTNIAAPSLVSGVLSTTTKPFWLRLHGAAAQCAIVSTLLSRPASGRLPLVDCTAF